MEQLIGAAQRTRNGSEMASRAWLKRRGRGRTIPEIPEAEPLVKSLEGSQTLTVRHPYVDDRPLEDGLPRLGEYQSSSALAMELSWANCSAASGIGDLSNIRAYLIYGQ